MRDSPHLGDHIKITQLSRNSRINLYLETSPVRDRLKCHNSSEIVE